MALRYKHNILIVDDDKSVLNSLKRLFRKENLVVFTASGGKEAIELLKQSGRSISLIISDQRMPRMMGAQFLEKSRKYCPDAVRFLLTGYSDYDALIDAINRGNIHYYFNKPWNDEELLFQVRRHLENYELLIINKKLVRLLKQKNKKLININQVLEQKVKERTKDLIEKNRKITELNRELEQGIFNAVRAFSSLLESFSPKLSGHGKRVGFLCKEVAQYMKLPENEVVQTELSGLLHDIGKVGFTERLNEIEEEEWNSSEKRLYMRHPEEGQNIVRLIKGLDHVGLFIRSHHERYDGNGFPDHLKREEIPLNSMIISVADTYDRIVNLGYKNKEIIELYLKDEKRGSDVPETRKELRHESAIWYLKNNVFKMYDPEVLKSFMDYLRDKGGFFAKRKGITLDELKPGVVLAESIYSSKGRFLLQYNTLITEEHIKKLKEINQFDPILDEIRIKV